jgi:hypothetical protein
LQTKRNASGIDCFYKPNFPGRVFKVAILKCVRSVAVAAVAAVAAWQQTMLACSLFRGLVWCDTMHVIQQRAGTFD